MDEIGFTVEVRVAVRMVNGAAVIDTVEIVAVEPMQAALADVVLTGQRPWVH